MAPARGTIALRFAMPRLLLLLAWLALALALLPLVGAKAQEASPRSEAAPQSYEALLERIKRGDSRVDFGAPRQAFAAGPAYRPYDPEAESLRSEMFSACAAEDYATALDRAVPWGAEAMAGDAAFSLRRPFRGEAQSS